MEFQSIGVFCGSKPGNNPMYVVQATQLGYLMAERNIELIYGGGNKGIMAAVANAVLEKNGKVTGIIPKILTEWEHQHEGISELIVVENMHTRKHLIYQKCDAAIILPGGYGTLDEFFEILTWNQLDIHRKPVFVLNTEGFYDHLIEHARKMASENFLYQSVENTFKVVSEPSMIFS